MMIWFAGSGGVDCFVSPSVGVGVCDSVFGSVDVCGSFRRGDSACGHVLIERGRQTVFS